MNASAPEELPGGLDVVISWVQVVHSGIVDIRLWHPLDDNLRLCYAQMYIYNNSDRPDEKRAVALARRRSVHPDFHEMLEQHAKHWRSVYSVLSDGIAYLGGAEPVGPDMEYVALFEPRHVGKLDGPALAHSFITRFVGGEWLIAATARRLSVPGWPPTEQEIPGLRADGN